MTTLRGARARRPTVGLLITVAVIAAACSENDVGSGDEDANRGRQDQVVDIEPTSSVVVQAAERSVAEPYRTEIAMHMGHYGESVTVLRGEVAGDNASYTLDYGAVLEVMADVPQGLRTEHADEHLTIDMVIQQPIVYVRIPELVLHMRMPELAEFPPTGDQIPRELAGELTDSWGLVDIAQLGDATPVDVQAALTGQGLDPTVYLDLVSQVEGPVEDNYDPEIRGERMAGLRTQVPLVDLMAVTGGDPSMSEGAANIGAVLDVYIDDAGFVRGVDYTLDMRGIAIVRGEDPSELGALADLEIGYSVEMYDYGDESIVIEEPTGVMVDITDTVTGVLSR